MNLRRLNGGAPIERLKDVRQVRFADPDASVRDADLRPPRSADSSEWHSARMPIQRCSLPYFKAFVIRFWRHWERAEASPTTCGKSFLDVALHREVARLDQSRSARKGRSR